jgi:predicted flap endonuclease-1-like 5' DNA nuclease
MHSANPEARAVLENALLSNPCFVARQKIVEAISILGGVGNRQADAGTRQSIADKIGTLGTQSEPSTYFAVASQMGANAGENKTAIQSPPPHAIETELTLLVGIDQALAQRLAELGYTRCAEVAHWTSDDVKRVSSALDLGKRISRENWIEQAALQATRLPPPAEPVSKSPAVEDERERPATSARDTTAEAKATFFSSYARPPLFDHRPQRIEPPFVAWTPIPEEAAATERPARSPAQSEARELVAPALAPPPIVRQQVNRPVAASLLETDTMGFAFADSDLAPYRRGTDEAEVVIVGSRSAPAPAAGMPPPIPAAPSGPASKADRAALPSLRRLVGAVKSLKVDTTPYAEDRGQAEEASVEIVRPKQN